MQRYLRIVPSRCSGRRDCGSRFQQSRDRPGWPLHDQAGRCEVAVGSRGRRRDVGGERDRDGRLEGRPDQAGTVCAAAARGAEHDDPGAFAQGRQGGDGPEGHVVLRLRRQVQRSGAQGAGAGQRVRRAAQRAALREDQRGSHHSDRRLRSVLDDVRRSGERSDEERGQTGQIPGGEESRVSQASAISRSASVSKRRPTSCSPHGRPCDVTPHGIEIAG